MGTSECDLFCSSFRIAHAYACDCFNSASRAVWFYLSSSVHRAEIRSSTHNVHGPHDDKFYKFLDGLQDEYDELRRTGYSGQGFLNDGKKLSTESHNLPPGLARERALAEAEKRRKLGLLMGPAGGNKLGGSSNRNAGKSLRQILAEVRFFPAWENVLNRPQAAERRQRDDKQCDHGDHGEAEAEAVKAEKDSLTVVDLTSSDSEDDLPPLLPVAGPSSSKKPLFLPDEPSDQESTDDEIEVISSTIKPKASSTKSKVQSPPKASTSKLAAPKGIKRKLTPAAAEIASKRLQTESLSNEWSCPACTYVNPSNFLQCEICASVKPSAITNDVEAVVNGPRATQNLRTADSWFCHVCAEENPTERWSTPFASLERDHKCSFRFCRLSRL